MERVASLPNTRIALSILECFAKTTGGVPFVGQSDCPAQLQVPAILHNHNIGWLSYTEAIDEISIVSRKLDTQFGIRTAFGPTGESISLIATEVADIQMHFDVTRNHEL
jgi:hypothetical protein